MCGPEYEYGCSSIEVKEKNREKSYSFRWYSDKNKIFSLKGHEVNLEGRQNIFGGYVDAIHWNI